MPGDDNEPVSVRWGRTISGTTDKRDETPIMIEEAARYNAATIRNIADVLYQRRIKRESVRVFVAALDAAIAVQVCLTDMLEPRSNQTAQ